MGRLITPLPLFPPRFACDATRVVHQLRWAGLLSELLAYRGRAASILSCRHIALARADKLIAKACVAILGGELHGLTSDASNVSFTANPLLHAAHNGSRTPTRSYLLEGLETCYSVMRPRTPISSLAEFFGVLCCVVMCFVGGQRGEELRNRTWVFSPFYLLPPFDMRTIGYSFFYLWNHSN